MRTMRSIQPYVLAAILACYLPTADAKPGSFHKKQMSQQSSTKTTLDSIIAIVNDDVILQSELDKRIDSIVAQLDQQKGPLPSRTEMKEQVLSQMITENIQLQFAKRLNLQVNSQQLNQAINRIAAGNQMSPDSFRSSLASQGIDYPFFREQIKNELLISQIQQRLVSPRVKVSDQDIQLFLDSPLASAILSSEYRLSHILIKPTAETAEATKVALEKAQTIHTKLLSGELSFSQAAIQYSKGQRALKGGDLGWRKLPQLPELFTKQIQNLTAGELTQPFQSGAGIHLLKVENKKGGTDKTVKQTATRHILIQPNPIRSELATKALIETLYDQLVNGTADFTETAKLYSDDKASKRLGGDLGWVSPGSMVPEFEAVMDQTQIKAISKPFTTQFGWHILTVDDRRQQDMSQQFRKQTAKKMLFRRKFEEELAIWIDEVRQQAFVEKR